MRAEEAQPVASNDPGRPWLTVNVVEESPRDHRLMSKLDRAAFTLSDIRAIRWLVLAMGGIAIVMLLITDRDSPLMVVGFVTIVTVIPLVAIYLLRRFAKKRDSTQPAAPSDRDSS